MVSNISHMVLVPLLLGFLQPADLELSILQDSSKRLDFPLFILQLPLQPMVRLLQGLAIGLQHVRAVKPGAIPRKCHTAALKALTLLSSRLSKGPGGSSKHRNPLTTSLGQKKGMYIYSFGKQRNPLKPKDSVKDIQKLSDVNFFLSNYCTNKCILKFL